MGNHFEFREISSVLQDFPGSYGLYISFQQASISGLTMSTCSGLDFLDKQRPDCVSIENIQPSTRATCSRFCLWFPCGFECMKRSHVCPALTWDLLENMRPGWKHPWQEEKRILCLTALFHIATIFQTVRQLLTWSRGGRAPTSYRLFKTWTCSRNAVSVKFIAMPHRISKNGSYTIYNFLKSDIRKLRTMRLDSSFRRSFNDHLTFLFFFCQPHLSGNSRYLNARS